MISSSTSAKRSIAWCNSPLHKLLCMSLKVACLTCVDLRLETPFDCQSVVVANACAARLFHIVRSQWHGGAWSWSSTSTFFMSDGTAWVWLGIMYRLAGRQRAQRAHKEHVVLSINDFNEPEISQTRPSKILPQASPVAACLRPEHTMPGAKQTNCFRFPPLRYLKLNKHCLSFFSSSWKFMLPLLSLLLSGTWCRWYANSEFMLLTTVKEEIFVGNLIS